MERRQILTALEAVGGNRTEAARRLGRLAQDHRPQMRGLGPLTVVVGIRRSVRMRLLVIALLPMLVLLPMMLGSTMLRWSGKIDDILITKVNGDLTIADQYLGRLLENSGERLEALAGSVAFDAVLDAPEARAALLAEARGGRRIWTSSISARVKPMATGPWCGRPCRGGSKRRGHHDRRGAGSARARFGPSVPRSAWCRPAPPGRRQQEVETRGMVIHSAAPVTLPDGRAAALVGGRLLNRNLGFIDTINALVYREQSLPEGSQGTATLFLDDVRISTNVRLFENVRALGTRVSAAVRDRVLAEGQTWLDRAFVVNDWYISAYEPIVDSRGERVGMLYVGFLETPFRQAKLTSALRHRRAVPADRRAVGADLPQLGRAHLPAAGAHDAHHCPGGGGGPVGAQRPGGRQRRDRSGGGPSG